MDRKWFHAMACLWLLGHAGPGLIGPEHLVYRGAFRLPQLVEEPPRNFSYGGRAMAHFAGGDPAGQDRFTGSLFVAGNDAEDAWEARRACWVAELSIPEPVDSRDVSALPAAVMLQGFADLRGDSLYGSSVYFELPKHGLQVVREKGVDYLAMVFGQHIEDEQAPDSCTTQTDPSCVAPLAARPLGAEGAGFRDQVFAPGGSLSDLPSSRSMRSRKCAGISIVFCAR